MKNKYHLNTESVRKLTDDELSIEIEAQRGKLYNARSLSVTEKVEDTSQFGEHKRNVARLLTEQNARRPKAEAAARPVARPSVPNKIKASTAKNPAGVGGRRVRAKAPAKAPVKSGGKPAAKASSK